MHISSLPSPCGIGTMGRAAYEFADFLAEAGQSCWQVLPLSPTGFGDSPYQCFSSFAGNPYFIDLDLLEEDGLLKKSEYSGIDWGRDPLRTDYGKLYKNRYPVLRAACRRLLSGNTADYELFCRQNAFWLDDYALFMSLKDHFCGIAWTDWDTALRKREASAVNRARAGLDSDISFWKAVQYLFFRQWNALHSYTHRLGISIIGDLPIYVAPDSCDIWASPDYFQLDEQMRPTYVAGCPPDGFSEDGQLWGNPLYRWDKIRSDGYAWWIRRVAHQFEIYDVLRIDHFRGFDEYYAIPCGAKNARNGEWRRGPGIELFRALDNSLGKRSYIAEDLGFLTDSVRELLRECGFPGMKVLQFAFDSREESDYLPHNFTRDCVAYTGTHDNDTINGWFKNAPGADAAKARDYLRITGGESLPRAMITAVWASVADVAITTIQDILELDGSARMNVPGTQGGNWLWRTKNGSLKSETAEWLLHITQLYGRK